MYTGRETSAPFFIIEKCTMAKIADQKISAEPKAGLNYTFPPFGVQGAALSRIISLIYGFLLN